VTSSPVGGIVDQIIDGETGYLVEDPHDLDEYARAVGNLLGDADAAREMGAKGEERARVHFLADRHLVQWAELFGRSTGR
jgi:trehalose synthase